MYSNVFGVCVITWLAVYAWLQLSGGMTESGKPMIAGDPHTSFLAPSFYFAVHLSAVDTGYDAIGASIPGLPGIKFGRNSDFAWSETSSGLDNQDLFILTGVNNTHYAVNGTIHPFVIKYIPVKVKVRYHLIGWVMDHPVKLRCDCTCCWYPAGQDRLGV
jgi:acyl-homoserine lactone acylase PvdQ